MRFDKIRTTMLAAALSLTACCAISEPAKAAEQSAPRPSAEGLAIVAHAERPSPASPGYQHWVFRWVPYAIELAKTDIAKCRSFVAMVDATAPEVAAGFKRAINTSVPGAVSGP